MESARAKYSLALGRLRRGPPELTLLSLHGCLEDALRGHAMRQRSAAALEPFPQLLEALLSDVQAPLSAAEAEGIRRMHRLRARVAHGEQITVTAATIDAYHRLAARLLPRYGVLVVGPDDAGAATVPLARLPAEEAPPRRGRDDVEAIPPRHGPALPERSYTTTRIERQRATPPRERSAYPDDELARYAPRPRGPLAGREQRGRGGPADRRLDALGRAQPWVLPTLIVVSIFLIGAAFSIGLQQMLSAPQRPPLAVPTASGPEIATSAPAGSPEAMAAIDSVAPTAAPVATPAASLSATPPGGLAVGSRAYVRSNIPGLNLRARAGTDEAIPILLALTPGTAVEVVAGPVETDGFTWWQVRVASIDGWCAGQFLETR
jgi:hypothetical protein